jgi:Cdc6-like AAA superfamily ATPase
MAKSAYLSFSCESIIFAPTSVSKAVYHKIMDKFSQETIRTEMLSSQDDYPRFALRLTKQERVICTAITINDIYSLVILEENLEHKTFDQCHSMSKGYIERLCEKAPISTWNSAKLSNTVTGALVNGKTIIYNHDQQHAKKMIKHSLDAGLYSDTQKIEYYFITGMPGTGKTIMALDILHQAKELGMRAVYITQSPRLLASAKKMMIGNRAQSSAQDEDSSDSVLVKIVE